MKKVIATPDAPKAVGPYSQAIEVNGTLYISGQIPVNPADGQIQEEITAAAHQSLKNIGAILKEAGMTYDNVVKTTVLLADIADSRQSTKCMRNILQVTSQQEHAIRLLHFRLESSWRLRL